MWEGIGVGVAVAALNMVSAWWMINWGFERDFQTFTKIFLGSMVTRLLLVGAVSVALFKFTAIHKEFYAGALIAGFVVFQILEIVLVLRKAREEETRKAKTPSREGEPGEGPAQSAKC